MASYFAPAEDTLLSDALSGFARTHAELVIHDVENGHIRARHRAPGRRVALLSGGGSGHEPLHVGFVGEGMLDAACPGRIFTSPHNRQIFVASRAVAGPEGVLHVVKNYTGDRINFGIAAERLAHEDIPCARVLVNDDLASESDNIATGRRGTGATVLVEKVLGAAADQGRGLDELKRLGDSVAARCRSIAVAARAHTSPATGEPAFTIPVEEFEFGVGIHGERADRAIPREPVGALVERMAGALLKALAPEPRTPLIAVVNGLGAVTRMELYAVTHALGKLLDDQNLVLARNLVGDFVTALDMRGFSLSLCAADDELVELLDAPASTANWRQ